MMPYVAYDSSRVPYGFNVCRDLLTSNLAEMKFFSSIFPKRYFYSYTQSQTVLLVVLLYPYRHSFENAIEFARAFELSQEAQYRNGS